MTIEVEQKFPVENIAALERRLVSLGAQPGETVIQVDRYYAHPQRDFAVTDEALRLRRVGPLNYITYKGPKLDQTTKTRQEIEISLAEGNATADDASRLLEALGFRSVAEVRKRRRSYLLSEPLNMTISLDQVDGVGDFVELEILAAEAGRRRGTFGRGRPGPAAQLVQQRAAQLLGVALRAATAGCRPSLTLPKGRLNFTNFWQNVPVRQSCLTLTPLVADNTAAHWRSTRQTQRSDMLSTLARKLGVVLLATSVVTAPVLGSMPRCTKTGAIAGSGNCCCAKRQAAEEAAGCQAPESKSCCAKGDVTPGPSPRQPAQKRHAAGPRHEVESPCTCKSAAPLPAVPAGKDRTETREEQLVVAVVAPAGTPTAQRAAAHAYEYNQVEPTRIPLRKVYCRWTI